MSDDDLEGLYRRPGFLLRRAHQLSAAVFVDETRNLRVTPTQYGIVWILSRRPGIDQITLARLLGVDRSTTSMVVATLVRGGFVARERDPADGRRRLLSLTAEGHHRLKELHEPAQRSVDRVLAPLSLEQRETFVQLLGVLTDGLEQNVPLDDGVPVDKDGRRGSVG